MSTADRLAVLAIRFLPPLQLALCLLLVAQCSAERRWAMATTAAAYACVVAATWARTRVERRRAGDAR